jgi:hypothetical protein
LTMLDSVHQKIRASSNATQLADLLDEYIALTARLAMSLGPAAPFLPGGAVLTAAVNAAPGSRP